MAAQETLNPYAHRLLLRGRALNLCVRLIAPPRPLPPSPYLLKELRRALDLLRYPRSLQALSELEKACSSADEDALHQEYCRLFLRDHVPPYETSYSDTGGAAHPFVLADIAGFYKAFGFQVQGERPDHLGAELEFLALLHIKEALAHLKGEQEGAIVCAEARHKFWQEHLAPWLKSFYQKLQEEASQPAFVALAQLIGLMAEER